MHLPENHRLHESRSDIRREDQRALNVLTKCGRYTETALRILQKIDNAADGDDLGSLLKDLYVILLANIQYMKDEFAVLFVNSTTNSATAKIFRALNKNTSAFSPSVITDLRSAASVFAAGGPQTQTSNTNRGAGFRGGFRGRGRGDFRGRGQRWQDSRDRDV